MISMRHKPYFLPQVNAPYTEVINQLDDDDVDYKMVDIDPTKLKPTQGIIFSSEVSGCNISNEQPVWLSKDYDICDGHHRYGKAVLENLPTIRAIIIDKEVKDACRLLNKIQDIYDYNEKLKLEETTGNDYINDFNDKNNDQTDNDTIPLNDFLSRIEEDNELDNIEEKKIVAYRKEPIKDNSVVGNFFYLKPVKGYIKYDITFDNLLDTNDLGIEYKNSQNPIDVLAKNWFPHINFKSLSDKYNIEEENIKNKTIAEKARSLGFDGIKYGENYLQGL